VLYDNQNFVFRGEFEFANDPRNFFNEEDPAVQRMARSFAESIVRLWLMGSELKKISDLHLLPLSLGEGVRNQTINMPVRAPKRSHSSTEAGKD